MSDYFVFDDVDSRRFEGIYVYFDEVDTTPSRVYEEIVIPARNGSLFIDGGRFDDARHTYHIIALTDEAGRSIINALASKVGYHRLEDSFHPNEFYDAVFTSDVEPRMKPTRGKSTFRITFTRKPQRFLTSGETAVTVTSGSTLANPTPFDSHPLLRLSGYGNIHIGSSTIGVASSVPLQVDLGGTGTNSVTLNVSALSAGDPIYSAKQGYPVASVVVTSTRQSSYNNEWAGLHMQSITNGTVNGMTIDGRRIQINIQPDLSMGLLKGTSGTLTTTVVMQIGRPNVGTGVVEYAYVTFTVVTSYNGSNTITISASESSTGVDNDLSYSYSYTQQGYYGLAAVAIPSPCYIDLDSGEAYGEVSGAMMSVNNFVSMPPELPSLKSGNNTITFDNTITSLKVTPRWWKV